ncbi:MAG: hypothetical protein CPSOU_3489 [uncultured Paraburkholderia sp.]|nr:MAG: hypothetical protein CPSOU_3489 [uncultured Paraburkholderia sp.]
MTKEDEIYASFNGRAEVRIGGEIFLKADDAQRFVAAAQTAGMAVLGIEGVRIDSNQVVPYVDLIADYSPRTAMEWAEYLERCNRLALDFLWQAVSEKGTNTYFCFELLDHAEYVDCLKKLAVAR